MTVISTGPYILVAPPENPGVLVTPEKIGYCASNRDVEYSVQFRSKQGSEMVVAPEEHRYPHIFSESFDPRREIIEGFRQLTGTTFADYPGTAIRCLISAPKGATLEGLFEGCQARVLPELNTNLDVGNLNRTFAGCVNMEIADVLSNRVKTTNDTFKGCHNLKKIRLYGFGISVVPGNILDLSETAINATEIVRFFKQNVPNVSRPTPKPVIRLRLDQVSDQVREIVDEEGFELRIT